MTGEQLFARFVTALDIGRLDVAGRVDTDTLDAYWQPLVCEDYLTRGLRFVRADIASIAPKAQQRRETLVYPSAAESVRLWPPHISTARQIERLITIFDRTVAVTARSSLLGPVEIPIVEWDNRHDIAGFTRRATLFGGDLWVLPAPSSALTLEIVYEPVAEAVDIDGAANVTDVPESWQDLIVLAACNMAVRERENAPPANQFSASYAERKAQMLATGMRRNVQGAPRVRLPRGFHWR